MIKDRYKKARQSKGKSYLLRLLCGKCGKEILIYQKDGRGNLLRCYLNRIIAPPKLAELSEITDLTAKDAGNLNCRHCDTVIGSPITHKDGRIAFRLRKGFYSRKRVK